MGYFNDRNMSTVQVKNRLPRLTQDFRGNVEVTACVFLEKAQNSKQPAYIVEFRLLSTNDPVVNPVGSSRSWYQNLAEEETGLGAIKGFLFALFGVVPGGDPALEERINSNCGKLTDASITTAQPFKGQRAFVETVAVSFKSPKPGMDPNAKFTKYMWSPVQPDFRAKPAQAAA